MQQILLNVRDHSKVDFLLSILREYDFVEILKSVPPVKSKKQVVRTKKQLEFAKDLRDSLKEVDLHLQGRVKMKSVEDLIKELETL